MLAITLLVRRAFCGYMCPIGTLSEWLSLAGRRLGLQAARRAAARRPGVGLVKYVLLGVVLWFTYRAGELVFRGFDPCYALISRHGADITFWAYVILGLLVTASLVIVMPFCRWLCPMAAVMNPLSRFGLADVQRIRRPAPAAGPVRGPAPWRSRWISCRRSPPRGASPA